MYRAYLTYYDGGGLTKHRVAGPKRSTYGAALNDLEGKVHELIEDWVPAGNSIKMEKLNRTEQDAAYKRHLKRQWLL